jgi:hypothetical protein
LAIPFGELQDTGTDPSSQFRIALHAQDSRLGNREFGQLDVSEERGSEIDEDAENLTLHDHTFDDVTDLESRLESFPLKGVLGGMKVRVHLPVRTSYFSPNSVIRAHPRNPRPPRS